MQEEYYSDLNHSGVLGDLTEEFSNLLKDLWKKPQSAAAVLPTGVSPPPGVSPYNFLDLGVRPKGSQFLDGLQHDCGEFCQFVLETLHGELARTEPSPQINLVWTDPNLITASQSIIHDLLQGILCITTVCLTCSKISNKFEPFVILSLPIPTGSGPFTLSQCLSQFSKITQMNGDNKYMCSGCNVLRDATRQYSIYRSPKLFIIQLMRFHNPAVKINAAIQFPTKNLNVPSSVGNHLYELYAVSNHIGTTRQEGHCTALRLNPVTSSWEYFDDDKPVKGYALGLTPSSTNAHLLFYSVVEQVPLQNGPINMEHDRQDEDDDGMPHITTFGCLKCPELFATESESRRHFETVHSVVKQYFCTILGCTSSFTRDENRVLHETNYHNVDTTLLTLDMISPPGAHTLDGWDQDSTVVRVRLLFHERTGLGLFSPETIDEDIANQNLTTEDKSRIVNAFQTEMANDMKLITCGSCGVRHFPRTLQFFDKKLCQLSILRLKNEQQVDPNNSSLTLPSERNLYDSLGIYKPVASVTAGTGDGHFYFLHPEFVTALGEVKICNLCNDYIRKNIRPPQSVAGGFDFGNILRLQKIDSTNANISNLKPLTHVELALIARVRQYGSIFKITSSLKQSRILTGHIISFLHTGPEAVAAALVQSKLPCVPSVMKTVKVAFVGPTGSFEKLRQQNTIAIHDLTVRSEVVLAWLRMLKKINPLYNDIEIDDSAATVSNLNSMTETLLATAVCITNSLHRKMDDIITSDVATVRTTADSVMPVANTTVTPATSSTATPLVVITAGHVFLSNHVDSAPDVHAAQGDLLVEIQNTLFPESIAVVATPPLLPDPSLPPPRLPLPDNVSVPPHRIIAQRTSNTPLNEFTENQQIFHLAFPNLFLFGKGVPTAGSLPNKFVTYLLRQFTTTFAHERAFLFTAVNQRQRHDGARATAARVRVDPDSFQQFCNSTADQNFKALSLKAVENPTGKEAKQVLATCSKFMKLAGKSVPFSPAARDAGMTKLYAFCQYFGMPGAYLTFAPDDVHQVLGIRLCYTSFDNTSFPADGASLLTALKNGETFFETSLKIGEAELHALMGSNPVAAAEIFNRIQNAVYEHLLGVKPDDYSKKTVPLGNNSRGVFGKTVAVFSVVETQARISLHGHSAVWASLPPRIIQQYAADPTRIAAIMNCLDGMFSAQLPLHVHVAGLARRLRGERVTRYTYTPSPNPSTHPTLFTARSNIIQDNVGCHQHSDTCEKSPTGKYMCRLARPAALNPVTSVVQLIQPTDVYDATTTRGDHWQVRAEGIESLNTTTSALNRDHTLFPIPEVDSRCIVLELGRPGFPLPATFEQARIQFDNAENLEGTFCSSDTWLVICDSIGKIIDSDLRSKVWNLLRVRNGAIVDFSPTSTSVLACNTAMYALGSVEQCKAILAYLLKYLVKDATALAHSLVIIKDALDKVEMYPSTAPDAAESTTRSGKQLLQVILNKLSGMTELADTQAASLLLGYTAEKSTDATTFVFASAAVTVIKERVLLLLGKDTRAAWNENENPLADVNLVDNCNIADDTWIPGGVPTTDDVNEIKGRVHGCASAPVYKILQPDGTVIPIVVSQEMNYKFRGPELDTVTLYEYPCIIDVVLKKPDFKKASQRKSNIGDVTDDELSDEEAQDPTVAVAAKGRRNTSTCFNFDPRHPLFSTHHQRIRSKLYVPVLAGGVPPPYPLMANCKGSSGQALHRLKEGFAIYILTLFSPWEERDNLGSDVFLPRDGTSWSDFCEFMATLDDASSTPPNPTFLHRCQSQIIGNIASNLRITPWMKKACVHYRARSCDHWGSNNSGPCYGDKIIKEILRRERGAELLPPEGEFGYNGGLHDQEEEDAVNAIAELRALTDPNKLAKEEAARNKNELYYKRASTTLHSIFDNPAEAGIDPLLPPPPPLRNPVNPVWSGAEEKCKDVFDAFRKPKEKIDRPMLAALVPPLGQQVRGGAVPATRLAQALLEEMPAAQDPDPAELDPPNNRPTLEQYGALQRFAIYIDAYSNYMRDSLQYVKPDPMLVLIHGGPGVGKTFLLNMFKRMLEATGVGCVSTAYMGVAASIVPGSETLCSLFCIPVDAEKGAVKDKCLKELTTVEHTLMSEKFDQRHCLIIDEISLVGITIKGKINQRCQAIAPDDMKHLPFGGMSVVIVGDFYQIPPVGDGSLYKGVMDRYVHKTAEFKTRDPSLPSMIGTDLFRRFILIELTTQCRAAKDPKHGRILRLLREALVEYPITDEVLTYLQQHVLCRDDVAEPRSAWTLAPVITTGNGERFNILLDLAIRSAVTLAVPVVRWKLPLLGDNASRYSSQALPVLYQQEQALWGTFVQGAAAYIKGPNVNPPKGCANGSPVIMHSLVLLNSSDKMRVANAKPGEVIILDSPPAHIIVRLMVIDASLRPPNETLVKDEVVLPLPTNRFGNRSEDVGPVGRHLACTVNVKDHIVESGFAITFHKIQGRTIPKIILELNQRPFKPSISYNMFLVALSRVATGNDFRILRPVNGILGLRYLQKLQPDPDLALWLSGYDEHGVWSEERASAALARKNSLQQQPKKPVSAPRAAVKRASEDTSELPKSKLLKQSTNATKRPFPLGDASDNCSNKIAPSNRVSSTKLTKLPAFSGMLQENLTRELRPPHPCGLTRQARQMAEAFLAKSVADYITEQATRIAEQRHQRVSARDGNGRIIVDFAFQMDPVGQILVDSETVEPQVVAVSHAYDISLLSGNNYINDWVLDEFMKLMCSNSSVLERRNTAVPCRFYGLLTRDPRNLRSSYNFSRAAPVTHRVHLTGEHLNGDILFPIQPTPNHWILGVVSPATHTIWVLDSYKTRWQNISDILLRWVQDEFIFYRRDFGEVGKWRLLSFVDLPVTTPGVIYPHQTDGTSCGIFTAIYAYYWIKFRSWPTVENWTQFDIQSLRLFIAAQLLPTLPVAQQLPIAVSLTSDVLDDNHDLLDHQQGTATSPYYSHACMIPPISSTYILK